MHFLEAGQPINYLRNSNGETMDYEKMLCHPPNDSTYQKCDIETNQIMETGNPLWHVHNQIYI